jgi:hypothetical protein
MLNSKYHRDQAKILAGLALSAQDTAAANRFNLAAMEHLVQAQAVEPVDRPLSEAPGGDNA